MGEFKNWFKISNMSQEPEISIIKQANEGANVSGDSTTKDWAELLEPQYEADKSSNSVNEKTSREIDIHHQNI